MTLKSLFNKRIRVFLSTLRILISIILIFQTSCKRDEPIIIFPKASFEVFPSNGTTFTTFFFNASKSYDPKYPDSILQLRWDWENDGIWDSDYTSKMTAMHKYDKVNYYCVKLEVKSWTGLTDIDTSCIEVRKDPADTFIDQRDGQLYNAVKIGSQIWMAENLNFETDTGSWVYNNKAANAEKYGRLYLWESAMNSCPDGWHLPSDIEWQELELFLGIDINKVHLLGPRNSGVVGSKLKEGGTSGFNALYAGKRNVDSVFGSIESSAYFWTTTFHSLVHEYYSRHLLVLDSYIRRDPENSKMGLSVRCIKD